ncbi:MAG: response regulator transcription factor [Chloroflexi bacterium]|nr:response regulator transcription factor [Chloroflexota bacterium]
MSQTLRILIADDHDLVRAGIRNLVEQIEGFDVIAVASDGHGALELIASEQPDIVLMDIAMPDLNGLEATRRALKDFPNLRIIILSMHSLEEYVLQALRAGAVGYLLKDSSQTELEAALQAVARDQTYLSPKISKHVARYIQQMAIPSPLDQLTSRQREILQLLGEGYGNQEIAHRLHISPKTVGAHRAQIMERLDIDDLSGLLNFARQQGLIPPE